MDTPVYFPYGEKEISYLKKKDKRLARVIDAVGHIDRLCQTDLFEAVVNAILGQQISAKVHHALWRRIKEENGRLTPESVLALGRDRVKGYGLSWRKADYILEFAAKAASGEFPLEAIHSMTDAEAIAALSSLRGVGVWTAEMILLFSERRLDIFAYDDLAIRRGICMVYHHKTLPRERFERYRKRFSPYGSVASLYFWAVAGGQYSEEEHAEWKP